MCLQYKATLATQSRAHSTFPETSDPRPQVSIVRQQTHDMKEQEIHSMKFTLIGVVLHKSLVGNERGREDALDGSY